MVGLSFFEVEQLTVPHFYINFRILFRTFVKMCIYISLISLILLLLWIICTMPDLFHIYVCNHVPWHPWKYSLFFYSPKIVIIQIRSMECRTPFLISIKCKFLVTGLLHMNCNSWKYHQRRTLARAFARNMTRKKEGKMRKWKIAWNFHKTTYLIFVAVLILMFL